jgi:hypothetical protein
MIEAYEWLTGTFWGGVVTVELAHFGALFFFLWLCR